MTLHTGKYESFDALAASEILDTDYRITCRPRQNSPVSVIAPHGGSIESRTSAIATLIAGDDFNLYLFEGLDPQGSFQTLHLTSHRFDEPSCLTLIGSSEYVVAIHGCSEKAPELFVGGLDEDLKQAIAQSLEPLDLKVSLSNHRFPARRKNNICNRGARGRGVQLEFSAGLRGTPLEEAAAQTIRVVLLRWDTNIG